ncbi:hypothetical protein GCM10028825_27350 [Spirosoma agri]
MVVGKWNLSRIRFSGYPSPFTSLNGDRVSSTYNLSDVFSIKNDKSFTETYSNGVQISDSKGTWDFTNNTLQLTFDDGSNETYTVDTTQDPVQLLSSVTSATDSLRATATSPVQSVPFKYQFIYTK